MLRGEAKRRKAWEAKPRLERLALQQIAVRRWFTDEEKSLPSPPSIYGCALVQPK